MTPFQLCHCGTAPGYPHAPRCPYPLFSDAPALARAWALARERLRLERHEELLRAEEAASAGDPEALAACQKNRAFLDQERTALERDLLGGPR